MFAIDITYGDHSKWILPIQIGKNPTRNILKIKMATLKFIFALPLVGQLKLIGAMFGLLKGKNYGYGE